MAAEQGLPSHTDFCVVGTSAADITEHAGPGELIADISTFDTRHGNLPIWFALSLLFLHTLSVRICKIR